MPREILVYDVVAAATRLATGACFIDAGRGTPDGFRVRCGRQSVVRLGHGRPRNWMACGVQYRRRPIGRIHLPERCANLCFGGRHRNRLFMAASQSVYALYVNTQGVAGG